MVALAGNYAQQLKAHKAYKEPELMSDVTNVRRYEAPQYDNSVGQALETTYTLIGNSGEQDIKVRRNFARGQANDTVRISIKAKEAKPEHPSRLRIENRSQNEMLARYNASPELQRKVADGLGQRNRLTQERSKWTAFKSYKISELPRMLKYRLAKDFAPENPTLVTDETVPVVSAEANHLVYELVK